MISLILADAEIERVPPSGPEGSPLPRIYGAEDAELGGVIVLDSYIHRHLLEGLEGAARRGRPDIAHSFLLLAQGSRACRELLGLRARRATLEMSARKGSKGLRGYRESRVRLAYRTTA